MLSSQVNNIVSPDANMPWNPGKTMSLLPHISLKYRLNKFTKSGLSHLPLETDFKTDKESDNTRKGLFLDRQMSLRAR